MNENTKYQALLLQLNDIESQLEDARAYAKQLYAQQKSLEMQGALMRKAILSEMRADNITKPMIVDGYKLRIKKKQDKLIIIERNLPDKYRVTKTVTEIDRALVKKFAAEHPQEAQAFAKIERGGYDLVVQFVDTGKHKDISEILTNEGQ